MKKALILTALTLSLSVAAQTNPLWMRHTSIPPDGQTIAFSYKGDVFIVPASDGQTRQLTSSVTYDSYPIWNPDGKEIAFVSDREDNLNIFIVDRFGGEPKRLATRSTDETPITWRDNECILFSAAIMPTAKSIFFTSSGFPQVYEVDLKDDRPKLFSIVTMGDLSINQKGEILYHDKEGYKDAFREHHHSPITKDIQLDQDGNFSKLTTFNGKGHTPRQAPDGASFYYLSEEDGAFNVYKREVKSADRAQITRHIKRLVRYLPVAQNGRICYNYDSEIYTQMGSAAPQKINVSTTANHNGIDSSRRIRTWGATEVAFSSNGEEIGFVLRGDVHVTNIKYKATKQTTNTPEQERSIKFSLDGLAIVYASEQEGLRQIY